MNSECHEAESESGAQNVYAAHESLINAGASEPEIGKKH